METGIKTNVATHAEDTNEGVCFSRVAALVSGWTLDFMFLSLCRCFREDKLDEFSETLSSVEVMSQSSSLKGKIYAEKRLICAFLARVMHGKQLDVVFEEDTDVMPLMSAAKLWTKLENTVEDKSLFKNIYTLLVVQSVAVCLEKGKRSSASSALKWFEDNLDFPQKLKAKLSAIVTQMETYHPFLMSFNRLLETVQAYLDTYLQKNPSDYLLKKATEVVQSSQSTERGENVETPDGSVSETPDKSTNDRGKKRKLLSTKIDDLWKPDSCKKAAITFRRKLRSGEISQMTSKKSLDTSNKTKEYKKRKMHKKWTYALDKNLKDGVKRHGPGNWSLILMDYDFEGRTGTMLKDRWRVLKRKLLVA